nr:MAG TPA: hypothetical protein [Inoviridae sp.]
MAWETALQCGLWIYNTRNSARYSPENAGVHIIVHQNSERSRL